ncbi:MULTISPECIES: hypothetical protein [unclassified Ensifer]|uniref:hypothetical protein n=1 Tax=unclassified Ensifer TaxID=2633371 RepID=UPI0008139C88|nr:MULTISPECIES: hypothetical protein [unclassified Ensifer]OCP09266.1 hypothetical protein BC374_01460 [Ensifer sp. LC13]OCP10448.1 hypothetical protein BBX50_01810 [Ensifer sp. LC11]OCP13946.1 hypothetical protein BC362_04145 [Ensifer sp. LC14]OCP32514.1 hypothetical protein BC364_01460 [Ensifer sp. LC499]
MSLNEPDRPVPQVDYLALYRSRASKANALIWSLSLSLAVAWLSIVEPGHSELADAIQSAEETVGGRVDEFRQALTDRGAIPLQPKSGSTSISDGTEAGTAFGESSDTRAQEFQKNDERKSVVQDKATEDIKALRQNVNFGAFGSVFSIPRKLVVLLWMSILVWLLGYIVLRREDLAKMLYKSIRRYLPSEKADPCTHGSFKGQLSDVAGEAPFWLAPIPSSATDIKDELKEALGWDESGYRQSLAISFAVVTGFLVVAIRVVYIGFMFTDEPYLVGQLTGVEDLFTRWSVNMLMVGLLLIAILCCIRWLAPPIHVKNAEPASEARRDLILMSGFVAVWSATTFALGRAIGWNIDESRFSTWKTPTSENLLRFLKMPRTASRKSAATRIFSPFGRPYTQGFYESTIRDTTGKSRVQMIYVDRTSRAILPRELRTVGWRTDQSQKVDIVATSNTYTQIVNLIAPRDAAYAFEQAAISELRLKRGGSKDKATEILDAAITREIVEGRPFSHDWPSTRLIDLLATIYARRGENERLLDLANKVETYVKSRERKDDDTITIRKQRLLERAERWRAIDSKWNRDRRTPANRVVWRWVGRDGKYSDIEIRSA